MARLLLILPLLFTLASCGSGGSSSDPTANASSVIAEKYSVDIITKTSSIRQLSEIVSVTISNVPEGGLHYGVAMEQEDASILAASLIQTSATTGAIKISFNSGNSLGDGIHINKVALAICLDEQCSSQIKGSPVIIDTKIEVINAGAVSISNNSFSVNGNTSDEITPEQSIIPVTTTIANPSELTVQISEQADQGVSLGETTYRLQNNQLELIISYTNPTYLTQGDHSSTYNINICHDSACRIPLMGSPFNLNVNYAVTKLPSDVGIAVPDVRSEINHDVLDAEYSSLLNSVAIASTTPENAVYIYYLDDLTTSYKIPLDLAPTAISFASAGDSNKIAVGHNSKVTFIDLDESNLPASSKKTLDLPVDVYDLVATESAVYAVPKGDQWESLYRIEVSNDSVTQSISSSIRAGSKIKMHPQLRAVYLTSRGLSSNSMEKFDIQTTIPSYISDSPNQLDHHKCGDLWINNAGTRIYTACGNTFISSDTESEDMIYTARLPPISSSYIYDLYKLTSVAESNTKNEISAIETENESNCSFADEACTSVLSFYTKNSYNRISASAFEKVSLDGNLYAEKPSFVFYDDEGTSVFVISQLVDTPTQKSYILEFKR